MKQILSALALALAAGAALAQATPVGLWKTIDDETKQEKSHVRITEAGGVLTGKVEKILTEKTDAVCDKCDGDLKNKPVQGMTILSGLKKDGGEWTGGKILDPNNGKVYDAKVKLVDGGKKLEMRGFMGVSLLGRTQTWLREQ